MPVYYNVTQSSHLNEAASKFVPLYYNSIDKPTVDIGCISHNHNLIIVAIYLIVGL